MSNIESVPNVDHSHPSTISSRYSSILGPVASKQTFKSELDLQSLPEVLEEEPLKEFLEFFRESKLEPQKSTEEICNKTDCFTFKAIKNPGLYLSYNIGSEKPAQAETDEDKYLRMVKKVQIAPIWRIVDSLSTTTIDLQFYGLDSRQIKPLCEALLNNYTVTKLNLRGNALNDDAMYHLGELVRKNYTLQTLDLQHCRISASGVEQLGNNLQICHALSDLDLSYNQFGDEGMESLGVKLGYNFSIKRLNLSHNNLSHRSGQFLCDMMEENTNIVELDLSWNQISEEQGLKKFLNMAAEQNESLLKLDLSWNNLGGEKVANIIKNFISQHRSLEELNLSYNKFNNVSELTKIAKGVNNSRTLLVLNMSNNGINAEAAFDMLSAINGSQTPLQTLHIDNTWVNIEFIKLSEVLKRQCGLKLIIEGVEGGLDIKHPDMKTQLLKRAHFLGNKPKSKKKKKDFGWFLLRLQKSGNLVPVKKVKFEKLVVEDNIKFDEGLIDELAKRFRNEDKKVDLNLMLEKYLSIYPETALPKVKEKKKHKPSKELKKTPIESGRTSKEKEMTQSPRQSVRPSKDALGSKPTSLKDFETKSEDEKEQIEIVEINKENLRESQTDKEDKFHIEIREEVRKSTSGSLQDELKESHKLEIGLENNLESNQDIETTERQDVFIDRKNEIDLEKNEIDLEKNEITLEKNEIDLEVKEIKNETVDNLPVIQDTQKLESDDQ